MRVRLAVRNLPNDRHDGWDIKNSISILPAYSYSSIDFFFPPESNERVVYEVAGNCLTCQLLFMKDNDE